MAADATVTVQGKPLASTISARQAATSPSMMALERALESVSVGRSPILIVGEVGSGKREIARRIHTASGCSLELLREVNCAALTAPELVYLAAPEYGVIDDPDPSTKMIKTLVLVEVGELDPSCQSALHDLVVAPIDEDRAEQRPRLIFLSSHGLEPEVRMGRFREDLYYRVSGVCLRVPPLRHRREDIPSLVDCFLSKYSDLFGRPKPLLSDGVMQGLLEYPWPGNVRELEDAARTIAAIGDERVAMAALKSKQRSAKPRVLKGQRTSLKEVSRAASRAAEKDLILKVLARTQWNRKRAAEELRISYKALLYKMKQIGMNGPHSIAEGEL